MVRGRVTIRVWSVSALERARSNWSNLPRNARFNMLTKPDEFPVAPKHVGRSWNMVLNNYLEALAAGDNPDPTHLALGDGTTAEDPTNNSLNNEVYRSTVGQDETDGRDRLTSTFISQDEANGLALREIGFTNGGVTDNWTQLTHTVLPTSDQIAEKTSEETVTYDYELLYRRVN